MFNPGLQHFLQTWKVKGDLVFVHIFDILHNSFPPPGVIQLPINHLLPLQNSLTRIQIFWSKSEILSRKTFVLRKESTMHVRFSFHGLFSENQLMLERFW